jgi:hypothetical protein
MNRSYTNVSIKYVFPWLKDKRQPNSPPDGIPVLRLTRQKIALTTTFRKYNKN